MYVPGGKVENRSLSGKQCNFLNLQEFVPSINNKDMTPKMPENGLENNFIASLKFFTVKICVLKLISLHLASTRIFQAFKFCFRIIMCYADLIGGGAGGGGGNKTKHYHFVLNVNFPV